jgi:uncharacterized membrane protein
MRPDKNVWVLKLFNFCKIITCQNHYSSRIFPSNVVFTVIDANYLCLDKKGEFYMKMLILSLLISTVATQAKAEVFSCGFTEPFISFSYDTSTQKLTEQDDVLQKKNVYYGITFQIKYAGTFLLKNKSGKVVAELKLNNNGSDGMSDAVYPYEAKYIGMDGSLAVHGLWGGCTSSLRPMVKEPK